MLGSTIYADHRQPQHRPAINPPLLVQVRHADLITPAQPAASHDNKACLLLKKYKVCNTNKFTEVSKLRQIKHPSAGMDLINFDVEVMSTSLNEIGLYNMSSEHLFWIE
jgi:hypothetical protein